MKQIIFVCCCLLGFGLQGQSSNNPFELTARLNSMPVVEAEVVVDTVQETVAVAVTTPPIVSTNPFDIVPTIASPDVRRVVPRSDPTTTVVPRQAPKPGTQGSAPLFGLILVLSLLLTLLFTAFRPSFIRAYQNVLNSSLLSSTHRELNSNAIIPMNIWYLFCWFNLGVLLFLWLRSQGQLFTDSYLMDILYCTGIMGGFWVLKHSLLLLLRLLFPIRKEVEQYNLLLILFGVVLGVLLTPINIAVAYLPVDLVQYAIYVGVGLVIINYVVRSIRGLMLANRFLGVHWFHFLLYICAIEIAPVLILLKLGLQYLGK